MARREHEVLAAPALIRTRDAHVLDPTLVVVVHQPDEGSGRHLDHHGADRQVERAGAVGRIGIRREADLARTGRHDGDRLVVPDAGLAVAVEDALDRHRRIPEAVGGHGALEIRVVAGAARGVARGVSALEGVGRRGGRRRLRRGWPRQGIERRERAARGEQGVAAGNQAGVVRHGDPLLHPRHRF
jgi:hypothetical protein